MFPAPLLAFCAHNLNAQQAELSGSMHVKEFNLKPDNVTENLAALLTVFVEAKTSYQSNISNMFRIS